LQGLVTQIDALSEAIREQRAAHIDGHIFTSLPRSGTVRAARLLAEIGDARGRFPTPEALACDTAFTNTTYSTPIPRRLSPVTASLPPREHAEADLQANAPAHAETIAIPQQQTESPNRGKSGAGDRKTPLAASGTGSRRRRRTTCLLGAVGVFTVPGAHPGHPPPWCGHAARGPFPLSGIFWLLTRKATDGARTRAIIATVASFVVAMIGGSLMPTPPAPATAPPATAPPATALAAPDSLAAPAAAAPALPTAPNPLLAPTPHQVAPVGARNAAFKALVGGRFHITENYWRKVSRSSVIRSTSMA
jgi:hypothetical protein